MSVDDIPERRGPGRPPLHPKPREEARPAARTRKRRFGAGDDRFALPMDEIPEGTTYEWKRQSVYGQRDEHYLNSLAENGWEPVSADRHRNWVAPNYQGNTIERDGMILMERPAELTKEARDELEQINNQTMRDQHARLGTAPAGTGPRDVAGVRPQLKTEYVRPIAD